MILLLLFAAAVVVDVVVVVVIAVLSSLMSNINSSISSALNFKRALILFSLSLIISFLRSYSDCKKIVQLVFDLGGPYSPEFKPDLIFS